MRIAIPSLGFETQLEENRILKLSIENRHDFSTVIGDIWQQYHGNPGEAVILSDNENQYKVSEISVCIWNPFDCDANDRKILTKVYRELSIRCRQELPEETGDFYSAVYCFLDQVIQMEPYHITYDGQADFNALFKAFDLRFAQLEDTLLEKLMDYLRIYRQVCHIDCCIAMNLKDFFTDDEMRQLYEFLRYEKLYFILIENRQTNVLEGEKNWIIDNDRCIIEAN